jgi:ABC-type transport system involved in Fe-S cluster assembly fused permease/ATPase subunit
VSLFERIIYRKKKVNITRILLKDISVVIMNEQRRHRSRKTERGEELETVQERVKERNIYKERSEVKKKKKGRER